MQRYAGLCKRMRLCANIGSDFRGIYALKILWLHGRTGSIPVGSTPLETPVNTGVLAF